jgi:thioredoxin-like negative regulator of GroEL
MGAIRAIYPSMFRRLAIACIVLGGCSKAAEKPKDKPAVVAEPDACTGATHQEKTGSITWYEDDLAAAKKCAAQKKLPLVIDEWAPWCHTCLSMKTTVFVSPAFEPLAGRFVWLSTDTDKDQNADVVAAYKPVAWPTFWVVDPKDGAIDARYVGSASVDQFRDFLTSGERGFLAAADPKSADGLLVAADRAAQAGDLATAGADYEAAIAAAPKDWPRKADALVSAMGVKARGTDHKACIDYALAHMDETGDTSSAADFLVEARDCIDPADPNANDTRAKFAARLDALTSSGTAPLSVDDRSDAMANLREIQDELGQHDLAVATAKKQQALLDDAAAKAPTPFAAMTYNWPRSEVYSYLGEHEKLVPALEKSAADLPEEYDPPYRLAWLYHQEKKEADALTWATKSVALAYGPRKARVQSLIVDIYKAQGDAKAEIEARKALIAIYQSLPPAQLKQADLDKAQVDLAALEAVESQPQN